jgi:hypothetical protein
MLIATRAEKIKTRMREPVRGEDLGNLGSL